MQLVDKKNYLGKFILSSMIMLFIVGCSSKNSHYSSSTKYYDENINKDQLLHAAKRVFSFSDKDDYIIDSFRNELNITKPKASYKFYTMEMRNDHYDFKVEDNTSTSLLKATLSLYQTYGIENPDVSYIEEDSALYELFWDRIDYFLGKKATWEGCSFYESNDLFCDYVDLDDNTPNFSNLIDLSNTTVKIDEVNITSLDVNASDENNLNKKILTLIEESLELDDIDTIELLGSSMINNEIAITNDSNITKKYQNKSYKKKRVSFDYNVTSDTDNKNILRDSDLNTTIE